MTIPVGKDGFVPEKEILNYYRHHYNEKQKQYEERRAAAIREGRRPAPDISLAKRDYSTTADRVIPLKCTPEQIAEWWADPSRCDVQDVDCAGPPKVNIPEGMTAAQKRDQGRIRVIATPLEERMIRRELVMGFEPGDVSRIAASGPVIQASPMARAVTGSYDPANNRVTVDRDRGLEQGTIVHELSHQLRATDRSRRGPVVTTNPDADIEESCTVAEQMARSDKVDYSGYYQKACVFDPGTHRWRDPTPSEARRMAEEDHMLFTEGRGKGLKGDAAIRSVERHWGESHIARLRMHGNKMAVNRMADETGMVERVSMARPRTKEEAERMAAVDVTNATAGRPGVAMTNISPAGRRALNSRRALKGRNRPRERVILDTNIIDQGAGLGREPQAQVIRVAHVRDRYLYTSAVDAELRRTTDPSKVDGINRYIRHHEKRMISPPPPTHEMLSRMPESMGNDRYILSDAIQTDTDIIVTNDKAFCSKGRGFGPEIMRPKEYLDCKNNK